MQMFFILISSFFLNLISIPANAQVFMGEIQEEIYSPYRSGISPAYDTTVDGTRPSYEKNEKTYTFLENTKVIAEETLPKEKIEQEIIVDSKTTETFTDNKIVTEEKIREYSSTEIIETAPSKPISPVVDKGGKPTVTSDSRTEVELKVEIRPSSQIIYPQKNFTPAQVGSSNSANPINNNSNSEDTNKTTNTDKTTNSSPTLIGNNNKPTSHQRNWFIVVKADSSKENLNEDQKKVQNLFKNHPVNIHEESGYYFLMVGPAEQDSIGIMMKIVEFNGYLEAATVVAR